MTGSDDVQHGEYAPQDVRRLADGDELPDDEPGKRDYVHDDPDDPERGRE